MSAIRALAVVGAGQMGTGIAQVIFWVVHIARSSLRTLHGKKKHAACPSLVFARLFHVHSLCRSLSLIFFLFWQFFSLSFACSL